METRSAHSFLSAKAGTRGSRIVAARLITVLVSCLVGLVASEVMLRFLKPDEGRYYVWKPNYSATLKPAPGIMPGVGSLARIEINSQGIIGNEWSQDRKSEYRILAIGGSTTECLYLDKSKTWPALLQSGLEKTSDGRKVWVGNLGKAGFNTRDHLALLRLAIDQYDVDVIVLLIGGNDMIHRLMQGASYDPHFIQDEVRYREWVSRRFAIVPSTMDSRKQTFFKRTALWRLVKELRQSYKALRAPIVQDKTGDWLIRFRTTRQQGSLTDTLPNLDSGLAEYDRNVTAIVHEARRRNLRVVLMTQPTIWKSTMPEHERNLLWMGWQSDGHFYTTDALMRAMESYNQRTMEICLKLNVECFDLANRVPRTTEMFYDDMHFNEGGAKQVGAELSSFLRPHPPFAVAPQLRAEYWTPNAKPASIELTDTDVVNSGPPTATAGASAGAN